MSRLQLKVVIAVFPLFAVALANAPGAANDPPAIIVLKAARLFDGKGKALITNGVVIVQAQPPSPTRGAICRSPKARK